MSEEVRAFICPKCGEPSKSSVHGRVSAYDSDAGLPMEFAFLQCGRNECQEPMVQLREDYGLGFVDDKPIVYYPAPRRLSSAVPGPLRNAFNEARTCFEAKAYLATLVMVRRTLEGTCADQGSTKRNLVSSLKDLQSQGKIDGFLAEWADLLRIVGNEGAHFSFSGSVTAQDAEDALDFAEALLDHLYVLRARFDDFKSRREARQQI
jgi:hypothetical protein